MENKALAANDRAWHHFQQECRATGIGSDNDREAFDWGWEMGIEYALSLLRNGLPTFFVHHSHEYWAQWEQDA